MPIRLRLALAFALAMTAVLAATGVFLYLSLGATLDQAIDAGLRSRSADVAAQLRRGEATLSNLDLGEEGLVQVLDSTGTVVASTPGLGAGFRLPAGALPDRLSTPGSDNPFRVRTEAVEVNGRRLTIVAAASLEPRDEALDGLLTQLLIAGPLALGLASVGGYLLAAAALRPVDAMSRRAREVSAAEPGRRLPVPAARDEVARLAETLNDMLARLEAGMARERRFVAEASHELRTPLALLRTEVELALGRARGPQELQDALRSVAEETDRLCRLAEDLLVLARSGDDGLPLRREPFAVAGLLDGVGKRFAPRAREAGRALIVDAAPQVCLHADPLRIEQAVGNLVDNALRHGAGAIRLAASQIDGVVTISVRDGGPGIAVLPAERGLGLSIVDVIVRAHGGRVDIAGNGEAAEVRLTLPAG